MMTELFKRRVPQFVGLYVAATWMMIEIGDWVSARFDLPPTLTSYIFVGMVALLPAVVVVAWFHGAPGKDRWTKVEKTVIPVNLIAAALLTPYLVNQSGGVAATEIREVIDETGQVQSFEVPRAGFHRRLSVFFLDNRTGDPQLDWLSYAVPVMIVHDLNHETPLVSAQTPLNDSFLMEELRRRGFADGLGAPRALQAQIAKARLSSVLLSGEIRGDAGQAVLAISVIDVQSGQRLKEIEVSASDWLVAADSASLQIQKALELEDADLGENDPLIDNLSNSIDAIRAYVGALVAAQIRNDYPAAVGLLNEAVATDPTFAEAYSQLGLVQFLSGQSQDALASASQAFAHDYRLSLASKFRLRALKYQYAGDRGAARRVFIMWTQVQPDNPEAYRALGRFLLVDGDAHDDARAAFAAMLDLDPLAHESYLLQATVEKSRGEFETAAGLVRQYLQYRADDPDAHLMLASISLADANLANARRAYEDAANLGASRVQIAHGVATLDIRIGDIEAARSRLQQLLEEPLTPAQRVATLNLLFETQYVEGRMTDGLSTLDRMDEIATSFMPPLLRILQIGATRSAVNTLLGDFALARQQIADMRSQLQPPFDAYVAFWVLSLEAEAGDAAAYRAALADAVAFYESSGNEALAPIVLWARAYGAWLDEDRDTASRLLAEAIDAYDRSFLQSLSESTLALESKIEMYRLMVTLGELDQARVRLEGLLVKSPAMATAHYQLARILFLQEDRARARMHIERALEIWRDADPTYLRLKGAQELAASVRE